MILARYVSKTFKHTYLLKPWIKPKKIPTEFHVYVKKKQADLFAFCLHFTNPDTSGYPPKTCTQAEPHAHVYVRMRMVIVVKVFELLDDTGGLEKRSKLVMVTTFYITHFGLWICRTTLRSIICLVAMIVVKAIMWKSKQTSSGLWPDDVAVIWSYRLSHAAPEPILAVDRLINLPSPATRGHCKQTNGRFIYNRNILI